jgi:hypothetical protein
VLAVALVCVGVAWAAGNTRIEITQDFGPPAYHDFGNLAFVEGELFAIHDDEWALIVFVRDPSGIPDDFDLLNDFDDDVLDAEVLIDGFIEVDDEGNLLMTQIQGIDEVPIWFMSWEELQDATQDGTLEMGELEDMESLVKGTADFYEEKNHVFGVHNVSHLAFVAEGTLDEGGTFQVEAVEVDLDLKQVRIDLDFD